MYSIVQESLEELMKMSPNEKYGWIFETIDVTPFVLAVTKKSNRGALETLNYEAMLYSLFIRVVERMPFIKDLVNRLNTSEEFRFHCRFTGSDSTPSEASYSRLIARLRGLSIFENCHDELILQAFQEGFLDGAHVAIDATHAEARDAANPAKKRSSKKDENQQTVDEQIPLFSEKPKEETPAPEPEKPKKRGRKKKEERERK